MEDQNVATAPESKVAEESSEAQQLSPDQEIAELEKLLSEEPDDFQARCRLGELYFGKGRMDEALTEVKKAIEMAEGLRVEMDRSLAMYYSNLGTIYGTKGMMDDAKPQFERALELHKYDVLALFNTSYLWSCKAGEGIGWVFQMGMGYTFYLPFALYMAGFIAWSYTVVKLVIIGRLAGYGIGLMFMAGYALQLSHLTFMVVVGLILLTLDKRGTLGRLREKSGEHLVYSPVAPVLSQVR